MTIIVFVIAQMRKRKLMMPIIKFAAIKRKRAESERINA